MNLRLHALLLPAFAALLLAPAADAQGSPFGPGGGGGGSGANRGSYRGGRNAPPAPRKPARKSEADPVDIKNDPYLNAPPRRRVSNDDPDLDRPAMRHERGGSLRDRDSGDLVWMDDPARVYFDATDGNGDGWVSYREARDSLGLDRESYAVYDANRDGMCELGEFRRRYEAVVARGGVFQAPKTLSGGFEEIRGFTAAEVIDRYDASTNQRLGRSEVAAALAGEGLEMLDVDRVLADLDKDGSGDLDGDEITNMLPFFESGLDAVRSRFERRPTSINELFGRAVPREEGADWAHEPPRIRGPVDPFRRLDLDDDGAITEEDLKTLQKPLHVSVRLRTVVATIDANHDGRIDREELFRSMGVTVAPARAPADATVEAAGDATARR